MNADIGAVFGVCVDLTHLGFEESFAIYGQIVGDYSKETFDELEDEDDKLQYLCDVVTFASFPHNIKSFQNDSKLYIGIRIGNESALSEHQLSNRALSCIIKIKKNAIRCASKEFVRFGLFEIIYN